MVTAMGSTKDHRYPQPHLLSVKGKRTKRPPRTGSPAALATLSPSSSSASYTGTDDGGGDIRGTANTATSSTTTTATASSAEYPSHITRSTTTAEEEEEEQEQDMANCLILLAQGSTYKNTATAAQKLTAVSSRRQQQQSTVSVAVTAPKAAAAAAANMMGSPSPAAAGVYPYECKTCNRCFPSFQALGGHRASHKKPKPPPPTELDRNQPTLSPFSDDGQSNDYNSSLSLQIGTCSNHHPANAASAAPNSITTVPLIINKPKVHECTICGAEFSSGQALGGHMRRHRALLTGATAPASAVSAMHPMMIGGTPMSNNNQDSIEEQEDGKRTRNLLALDLNLPAPEEDHRGDQQQQQSKFVFKSNDNTLFFSASSLVDCHH